MVTAVITAMFMGCATTPKGPTDEELIRSSLGQLKTGLESGNLDLIMSFFSEEFRDPDMRDKSGARREIDNYLKGGELRNAKVSLDTVTLAKIDETTYNVDGIKLTANFGSGTLGFTVKKEADGTWRAVRIRFSEN